MFTYHSFIVNDCINRCVLDSFLEFGINTLAVYILHLEELVLKRNKIKSCASDSKVCYNH